MQQHNQLPTPSPEAQAHSDRLTALIRGEIDAAGGAIDFSRFMELALYAPGLGYYSGGSRKFGEAGDFVTAPELSPLFSRCLANQCMEFFTHLGPCEILEFGAGTGVMAAEILAELQRRGQLPERYLILELSGELRERQRETLEQRVPDLLQRVVWLDALPEKPWRGVVLANEVADAMPVTRFEITEAGAEALQVAWGESGFVWRNGPFTDAATESRVLALKEQYRLPPGYRSELNLAAEGWLGSIAEFLEAGAVLVIDYGFPAHEFYHPQRNDGTLMCHYRHRAHPDPLILAGLQDITAHVDFTALAEAAYSAGLSVRGFANQANFLLGNGLAQMAQAPEGDAEGQWDLAMQVKRLTMPGEMGELFKVLGLVRGIEGPLAGFALRDERGRL